MASPTVFKWSGSIRAALRSADTIAGRLLDWNAKVSARGNPLFTYAEASMIGAARVLFQRLLAEQITP